jgi:hypothetical protein
MEIATRAHIQKKQFIERLLAVGDGGPLALLSMDCDGSAYLKQARATYLIGMVGLNELVQIHRGVQLHENEKAVKFGIKVLGHIQKMAARLGRQHNMRFILEQTPAESTAYRFARLDLKYHSPGRDILFVAISPGENSTTRTRRSWTSLRRPTPLPGSRARGSFTPSSTEMPSPPSGWANQNLPPRHLPGLSRGLSTKRQAARSFFRRNLPSVFPVGRQLAASNQPVRAAVPPGWKGSAASEGI